MGQKNFKFEISDLKEIPDLDEELSDDDRKVASMLGALKRVEAPADFDLHLKGRIARGIPAGSGSVFTPWLRYAAMPALLLVLAGFLAFNGMFTFDGTGVPPVAEVQFQPSAIPAPTAEPTIQVIEIPREIARDEITPATIDAVSRTSSQRRDRSAISTNSIVQMQREPSRVINPPGIPLDPRIVTPEVDSQDRGISVKDILSSLGIAGEKAAGGWKVTGIAAKSQAENAGVQVSDVVEAVGPHAIKGKDSLNGSVSADSITVVRGGKRVVIKLAGR